MFSRDERTKILLAARLSEAVYLPFESDSFAAVVSPYRDVETWTAENAQGMALATGKNLYIVFRGTEKEDWEDAMTDLNVSPFPFSSFARGATVHYGFWKYSFELSHPIRACIAKHPDKNLIVCGHSLGGSAAIITAAELWLVGIRCRVITFGAAPVGNASFRNAYNAAPGLNVWRFEHAGDIVPRLPTLAPWLKHVGQRIYLPFFGREIQMEPKQIKRWTDIILRRAVAILSLRPFSGVKDHGSAGYTRRLTKAFS